jgi:hypothetical protein
LPLVELLMAADTEGASPAADPSWENRSIEHPDEDDFVQAANALQLHYDSLSFDQLRASFEAIGATFEQRMQGQWRNILIVRRVVTEHVLTAAMVKQRPLGECEQLLVNLLAIGWHSLEEKALKLLAFGRFAADLGAPAVAARYLAPLAIELRAERERSGAAWCAEYLVQVEGP